MIRSGLVALILMGLLVACGAEQETPSADIDRPSRPTSDEKSAAPTAPPDDARPPERAAEAARPATPEAEPRPASPEAEPRPETQPSSKPVTSATRAPGLPSDYPDDAPVYPGATPIANQRGDDGRLNVVFRSDDDGKAINDYMSQSLRSMGWQIKSEMAMGGQFAIDGLKGERRIAVLTANDTDAGHAKITVLVSR
jgi:hypothetical protein